MASSSFVYPVISQIPIDLLISKKLLGLPRGQLTFTDANGNLVFTVDGRSSKSTAGDNRVLFDARGNPLISICRKDGGWHGFRGGSGEWKDLIFRVKMAFQSRSRKELEVFLVGENSGDSNSDFKVKGCPFYRSCTFYEGNSIVAQTSLLYKLGKVIVGRRRFRLTIFPGFVDHALVAALIVIFLSGRK